MSMCEGKYCQQPVGRMLVRGLCRDCAPEIHAALLAKLEEAAKNFQSTVFPHVELLQPQPGDLIILRHPGLLSPDAFLNIRESFKKLLPDGVRVVVLEEGMEIKLLRPEKAERYVVEGGKE